MAFGIVGGDAGQDAALPQFEKWSRIELSFNGPKSIGLGQPNPFAIGFDIEFTSPNGRVFRVPGFYDGDGQGGLDGDVWNVRFSADQLGVWTYRSASDHSRLDGQQGRVEVVPVRKEAQGFWRWGRLEAVGTSENGIRYLKFRDGPYWLKAGCDDPENFLGAYENFNTPAKRRAAIDYLANHGINSLYIMTHNVDGDDDDVWPWIGETSAEAKRHGGSNARFDVAKLDAWKQLFEHMQNRGVVAYLILEDDSAWTGYDHDRYHREIIARFGYLPGLVFNLGEEHNENYSLEEGIRMATRFKAMNPYRHALAIHNINRARDAYIDAEALDMTAIQTGQPGRASSVEYAVEHHQIAVDWIERCRQRGRRTLVVNFDEGRPEHDRRGWWSAYLGGGVWEAHVTDPYDRPHSAWEGTWIELGGARRFMESIPFHDMHPRDDLVRDGQAFCLAKPGQHYALYLPAGGRLSLWLEPDATYAFDWWSPGNGYGGSFEAGGQTPGGLREFEAPTNDDWALRVLRQAR